MWLKDVGMDLYDALYGVSKGYGARRSLYRLIIVIQRMNNFMILIRIYLGLRTMQRLIWIIFMQRRYRFQSKCADATFLECKEVFYCFYIDLFFLKIIEKYRLCKN